MKTASVDQKMSVDDLCVDLLVVIYMHHYASIYLASIYIYIYLSIYNQYHIIGHRYYDSCIAASACISI